MSTILPIPDFFDPDAAARWDHRADHQALAGHAREWIDRHQLRPAAGDSHEIHLLLIDLQKDFCLPEGSLYVAGRSGTGAIDDSRRIARFIYQNLANLTRITATLDSHFSHQIFSPSFWLDRDDRPPAPHTIVTTDAIASGELRPNPAVAGWLCRGNYGWLRQQVEHYCRELERVGKYELYLWPPHCLLGSDGHALVGVVDEARSMFSLTRSMQSWIEVKGGNPLTENYSVLRPELLTRHDGAPLAQRNTAFIETLLRADAVIIAGQAASHCVKSTIDDLLDEIVATDPALARKVYIMTDCMSAVTVPDGQGGLAADFSDQAEQAQQRFADAGMHLVQSTTPIADWPGR